MVVWYCHQYYIWGLPAHLSWVCLHNYTVSSLVNNGVLSRVIVYLFYYFVLVLLL